MNNRHQPLSVLLVGFLMMAASAAVGQVNTTKPSEQVERQLSSDEIFREWSMKPDQTTDDANEIKRLKVCRVDELCKMRFVEGQTPRTRVKNLVAPFRYEGDAVVLTEEFTRQIRQALTNLQDKRGVKARFIGYTDDAALTGRDESIYGNQLSLSKARAQRVAEAIQEALALSSSVVESDGRGAVNPIASNDTVQGRMLNRRIEVEFWYDDPLQELPEEPQVCPGDSWRW
jgi:outer membrane protein OmpA-like peptidoglycan-associated protein